MRRSISFTATILGWAAFLGLVTGCTTTSAGEPRPQDAAAGQSASEGPSPRPRDIQLDGKDPCELIPRSDYSDFYLEDPGKPGRNRTFDGDECTWDGTEVGYFAVVLITDQGVEMWLNGTTAAEGTEADPIADFPAYSVLLPEDEGSCFVTVDVADGQQLLVHVGIDRQKLSAVPPVCEYAHQFASSAMSTLVES